MLKPNASSRFYKALREQVAALSKLGTSVSGLLMDPLLAGAFLIMEKTIEAPIWSFSFKELQEQGFELPEDQTFTLVITDPTLLQVHNVPREYDKIVLERMLVYDHARKRWILFERYYVHLVPALGDSLKLIAISHVVYEKKSDGDGDTVISMEMAHRSGAQFSYVQSPYSPPESLLKDEAPLGDPFYNPRWHEGYEQE